MRRPAHQAKVKPDHQDDATPGPRRRAAPCGSAGVPSNRNASGGGGAPATPRPNAFRPRLRRRSAAIRYPASLHVGSHRGDRAARDGVVVAGGDARRTLASADVAEHTPRNVASRLNDSSSEMIAARSPVSTSLRTRSAIRWAISEARSDNSPCTRCRESAAAESSSSACWERFWTTRTEPTANDTTMAEMTATAMYLLLKLTAAKTRPHARVF